MVPSAKFVLFFTFLAVGAIEAWDCECKTTPSSDDGGGNMVYLDRHHLRCGARGMVRYQLERTVGGNMRFSYFCCNLPRSAVGSDKYTTYTYDGDGNTVYLDRQSVDCGAKAVISGFYLQRNPRHDHVRYRVFCKTFTGIGNMNCYDARTDFNDDGDGRVYYLDRHNVACRDGYYLNRFGLNRDGSLNNIRISYKCCKP